MLRSLNSGVSGLRNQEIRLDVIGSNIANVNTTGYKAHRVNFQEQFSETLRGGSAPAGALGGTNPMEVGLGVAVGAIDTLQTQGTLNPTGKNTDLAISGDGFFIMSDGKNQVYTRDGSFDFDRNGNFIKTSNGFRVMGWNAQPGPAGTSIVNNSAPVAPIIVPAGTTNPPLQTSNVKLGGNLEALTPVAPALNSSTGTSITFFDSQGNPLKGTINFTHQPSAGGNSIWGVSFTPVTATDFTVPAGGAAVPLGQVQFNGQGAFAGYSNGGPVSPTPLVPINLTPTLTGVPLSININLGTVGQPGGLTQFNDPKTEPAKASYVQTAAMVDQDGYSAGSLTGVSVDATGIVSGVFTNGRTRILAQVAMASFTNPGGLAVQPNNVFASTPNSGEAQIGIASTGQRGAIAPGALENSNVDLASAFSDLIVAQRGLQSNSKIITTSDEVLQELMQLKR